MEKLNEQRLKLLNTNELINIILENQKEIDNIKNESVSLTNKLKNANQKINFLENEVEVLNKQILKEKVYIVNKQIYQKYDSEQKDKNDDIEMSVSTDKKISEEMFNKFKKYISEIDMKSQNNIINQNNNQNNNQIITKIIIKIII